MSGGYFNSNNYMLGEIADDIDELIAENNQADEWGYMSDYNKATIDAFRKASAMLREASIYVHRIDYLVSNDDSEESFHARLKADLKELKE